MQAADAVRVLGICRNEYIAMLNQCEGLGRNCYRCFNLPILFCLVCRF